MGEKLSRMQVLLEPRQRQALEKLAQRSGRSVSEVIRELVDRQLQEIEHKEKERFRRTLGRIRQHNEEMRARMGNLPTATDVAEMINEMREERDAEIAANLEEHRARGAS